MKHHRWVIFLVWFIIQVLCFSTMVCSEVNIQVGVNVPPPPPLLIPAPPPLVVVPRTYVYFAPEVEVDIFFYQGYWYRPYEGRWYRAKSYKGPWIYLVPEKVPHPVLRIPPDFRRVTLQHKRIPHGHVVKNWKTWEREKYWERRGGRDWHGDDHPSSKGKGKGRGKHRD